MHTYGAYLRIIASTLIFRAARRYLSDSSRSDEESVDMSARVSQGARTIETITTP